MQNVNKQMYSFEKLSPAAESVEVQQMYQAIHNEGAELSNLDNVCITHGIMGLWDTLR